MVGGGLWAGCDIYFCKYMCVVCPPLSMAPVIGEEFCVQLQEDNTFDAFEVAVWKYAGDYLRQEAVI